MVFSIKTLRLWNESCSFVLFVLFLFDCLFVCFWVILVIQPYLLCNWKLEISFFSKCSIYQILSYSKKLNLKTKYTYIWQNNQNWGLSGRRHVPINSKCCSWQTSFSIPLSHYFCIYSFYALLPWGRHKAIKQCLGSVATLASWAAPAQNSFGRKMRRTDLDGGIRP